MENTKEKYSFENYVYLSRWSSYWHQIKEILKCRPNNVLEIGVGDKVVSNYLKNNTKIKYTSLDINSALEPDIVGNIENLDMDDNSYDVVCAFEVLEHLPFEKFNKCLKELKRVSRKYVIISLPHWGRHFSISIHLPYFKTIKWQYKFNLFPIEHKFNGEHYWEIGKIGYSLKNIKSNISDSGFIIKKDYVVFESPYHHIFILKK